MKRYIAIIACVLLALPSCKKMELEKQMRANKSYVTIEIDGVEYKSKEMNDLEYSIGRSAHLFDMYDQSFTLDVQYTMTSKSDKCVRLNLRLKGDQAFETGKTYLFPTDPKVLNLYSTAKLTVNEGGIERFYYAQNGSLVIDEIGQVENLLAEYDDMDKTGPTYVNGSFSFEAYDEVTGKTLNVNNGIFHRAFLIGHRIAMVSNR